MNALFIDGGTVYVGGDFSYIAGSARGPVCGINATTGESSRLAVDSTMRGQGLGEELLMHAIDRARTVGKMQGTRAVVVDAKDSNVEGFYTKYGFEKLINEGTRASLFLIL